MILAEEKAKAINEKIGDMNLQINGFKWSVTNGWNPDICLGIMAVINVGDLTQTINHLTQIRNIIEEETGIRF